jgi:hypothetical protein
MVCFAEIPTIRFGLRTTVAYSSHGGGPVNTTRFFLLLVLVSAIALAGCEGDQGPQGPAGPAGADGADGANGYTPAMCLDCHNDAESLEIQLAYAQSGHKAGNYVAYAGGRQSCARCHSKQGFIEYATTGEVSGDVSDPASLDCAGCHIVHPADFGIRATDPVAMIWDETYEVDFGDNSNLCANCHQSRRAEPNLDIPGDTYEITSTHYGPHHGAQANVLEGVGFAEIDGSTDYPNPGSGHAAAGMTCVACHMYEYDSGDEGGEGGHTWIPRVAACQTCHAGATDFDINGTQTENQDKLDQLRDLLVDLGVVEYVEEDEAYEPIPGTYPMIQVQAFFNWIGLEEDRSLGVHNPSYYEALLDNSIEALTD